MKKVRELTVKQKRKLLYISDNSKSKRIRKKVVKRLTDGFFHCGDFTQIQQGVIIGNIAKKYPIKFDDFQNHIKVNNNIL